MNKKTAIPADQSTTIQILAKSTRLIAGMKADCRPIDSSVLRFVVSPETYVAMLSEAPAALREAWRNGISPNIYGIRLDRDNQVPDNEVELRWIVGRSWA